MPKDRKDALVFDWKHVNGGWVDLRLAYDLKWDPQDLAPFVKGNGSLVFYVKAIEPGSDMTVYIENNQFDSVHDRALTVLLELSGSPKRSVRSWRRSMSKS